jgi:hypothetical protein
MKYLAWLAFAAISASVFGQHRNGTNEAQGQPGPSPHQPILSSGLPPVAPIPPLGNSTSSTQNFGARRHSGPPARGFGFGGYPYLWGDYGDVYAPQPEMPYAEPAPPPARLVVLQPALPVRPEIHEYTNPAAPESPEQEPPVFTIALEDGSTRSAVAVAVQGDALSYVDEDDVQQRISLDAIDRAATRRLNRAKGLHLRLPPANQ